MLWISAWQMPGVKFIWPFVPISRRTMRQMLLSKTNGAQLIARGLFVERRTKRKKGAEIHIGLKQKIYKGVHRGTLGYPPIPFGTLGYPGTPWGIPRNLGYTEGYPRGSSRGTLGYLANSVWGRSFFHLWFSPLSWT